MNQKYYKILGVSENSTIEEIKKAYKEKVKQYHPDVNHDINSDDIIKQINMAYKKIMETKKILFKTADNEIDHEYKISSEDFDINNLDPNCIFIGDIYVVKYKPNYDWFASFKEQTYLKLKETNAKLLRIGFERYINLSKIKTSADAKQIKEQLKSYNKNDITIVSDFFMPYAGDQIVLNVKPYSNFLKIEKQKNKKVKKLTKIFSTSK